VSINITNICSQLSNLLVETSTGANFQTAFAGHHRLCGTENVSRIDLLVTREVRITLQSVIWQSACPPLATGPLSWLSRLVLSLLLRLPLLMGRVILLRPSPRRSLDFAWPEIPPTPGFRFNSWPPWMAPPLPSALPGMRVICWKSPAPTSRPLSASNQFHLP